MKRIAAALLGPVLLLAGIAAAPAATQVHVRGTIEAFRTQDLTVKTREGGTATIDVPLTAHIVSVKKVALAAVTPGTYVGVAARPGPGGTLQALEVLVFPASSRGTGEGHYPWDLMPGSTMTNAEVSAAVKSGLGRELKLSYKGGTQTIIVPPGTPIVTPVPAVRTDLVPGAPVVVFASRDDKGHLVASTLIVGKNGVAPPM